MTRNAKVKVVMIGLKGLPAHGGAATVGQNIIFELKDKFDFTVLSVASHARFAGKSELGYSQVIFPAFLSGGINTFVYYIRCLLYCRKNSFDIIHLHHGETGFITPFLAKKFKIITTLHGVLKHNDPKFSSLHNRFFRFSEKQNVRHSHILVSVSKPDQTYVKEKYGREIEYIPNNVNVTGLETKALPENPYIFFAAGRIYQIKGLHLLLLAARKLGLKDRILIAGDLDQVSSYRDKIRMLASGLNVEFLGLIRDKKELLKLAGGAEVFVFPSTTEAMSIMLLEAVSVRVPVIASDIPANRAVFNPDQLLFFESDNFHDLAAKLEFALKNAEIMRNFAEQAYQRLVTEYTGSIVGSKYENLYNRLLS